MINTDNVLHGFFWFYFSVVGKDSADVREEDAVAPLDLDNNAIANSLDFIWGTTTVAVGDTAVLHCSFDAIFRQLRNGNVSMIRLSLLLKVAQSSIPSPLICSASFHLFTARNRVSC